MMSQGFRTGMDRKMLCHAGGFQIFRVIALETFDKGSANRCRQLGVFSVGLLPPAPTGIPKDIDIGSPKGQARVLPPVTYGLGNGVFGPGFIGNCGRDAIGQLWIEGSGKPYCLGKDCRFTIASLQFPPDRFLIDSLYVNCINCVCSAELSGVQTSPRFVMEADRLQ